MPIASVHFEQKIEKEMDKWVAPNHVIRCMKYNMRNTPENQKTRNLVRLTKNINIS